MAWLLLSFAFLALVMEPVALAASIEEDPPEGLAGGTETEAGSLFNITKILDKHSDYSEFNSLLSQHKVADMINRRKTITVLAVADTSEITSHPEGAQKRILMNHVILDFWGMPKLKRLKKSARLTTMLQTTGAARTQQGFIEVTKTEDGDAVMGSAVPDADHNSKVLKSVMMQPFDISILAISTPIIAPGVDKMTVKAPTPDRARAPRSARAPAPNDWVSPPVADEPAEDDDDDEVADAPAGKKKGAKAPGPDSAAVCGSSAGGVAAALMGLVWLLAVV